MRHEYFMNLALEKAEKVRGTTYPNPPVGAVLVKKNEVISAGATRPVGGNHAEVEAIQKAGPRAKGCTLYVTLEPCCHFGRTPPCTDLIIQAKIKRVFIGMTDPNLQVKGKGIRKLRKAGIIVQTRLLSVPVGNFYREYVHRVKHKRPYVYLKIAQSIEGSVNTARGERVAISHLESQKYTHLLRNRVDAILIGGQTLRTDNPDLTPRLVPSNRRKYPECLVVSKTGHFSKNYDLLKPGRKSRTRILSRKEAKVPSGVELKKLKKTSLGLIHDLMQELNLLGYHSVLIEAGPGLLKKWIESGLWDSFQIICSTKSVPNGQKWGKGLPVNWQENLKFGKFTRLKEDCIWELLPAK